MLRLRPDDGGEVFVRRRHRPHEAADPDADLPVRGSDRRTRGLASLPAGGRGTPSSTRIRPRQDVVGRLSAHRAKVPHVLHTVHGFPFHESSSAPAIRFYGALERRAARWCERLIFVNEFHRRWALQMRIASPAKTVVIPNGLPLLPAGSHEKAVHRSELGIPADAEVIGVIGRLAPDKRVEDLVEVMPQLVAEFPSAVLLLVGDGPSSDSVPGRGSPPGSRRPCRDHRVRRRRGAVLRDRRCRRPPDGAGGTLDLAPRGDACGQEHRHDLHREQRDGGGSRP